MADWSKPTITSNYVTFVDEVKNRDIDAITLQLNDATNPPVGAVKMLRGTGDTILLFTWSGTAYTQKMMDIAGGGTSASNAAAARSNLGIGTMGVQNSNAVAITGGTASGLTLTNTSSLGYFNHNGGRLTVTASVDIGLVIQGLANNWTAYMTGGTATGWGLFVGAGSSPNETAFAVLNQAQSRNGMTIRGDMVVVMNWRLVIPVGTDLWA